MPIVIAIRSISPSLVKYLQVNTIAGIQVCQLKFLTGRVTLVRVSHQLHNLDMRLYQSVFLDHNYSSSCAIPTRMLFLTDCQRDEEAWKKVSQQLKSILHLEHKNVVMCQFQSYSPGHILHCASFGVCKHCRGQWYPLLHISQWCENSRSGSPSLPRKSSTC